jgi:hypothetical protein
MALVKKENHNQRDWQTDVWILEAKPNPEIDKPADSTPAASSSATASTATTVTLTPAGAGQDRGDLPKADRGGRNDRREPRNPPCGAALHPSPYACSSSKNLHKPIVTKPTQTARAFD